MGLLTWQKVLLILVSVTLIGGTMTYTDLYGALFNLKGMNVTYSGDTYCDEECPAYINVTTSYWRVCFAHYNNTKYEEETLFKKRSRSRTLHVNLYNIDNIITTELLLDNGTYTPYDMEVDWLVPARGAGNWRFIKDGDCWDRKKINKINLVSHKEPEQQIKWSFKVGDYVDIDPVWLGEESDDVEINHLNYQTDELSLGNNKFSQTSYLGFINYKEKDEFKSINMTLIDYGTHWKTIKSVYYPTIPKYADEWSEFNNLFEGNNHSIKVRPIANHVNGIINENNTIVYLDAFDKNIDLEIVAYNNHLLRKIIIKEYQSDELSFDFEIDIDTKLDYEVADKNEIKTSIVLNSSLKEKGIIFGEGKSSTIMYPMKVWDSNNSFEYIDYKLYQENGKLYFKKIISKEFLENAVYPVYTDDDTGVQNPGTMAVDASIGTKSWNNVDNAKLSDNSYTLAGFEPDGLIPQDTTIKIVKSDASLGGEDKGTDANLPAADAYRVYGDATDLWSESWSDTDINNANFGVVASYTYTVVSNYLKATNFGFSISGTIVGIKAEIEAKWAAPLDRMAPNVDHIRMTVYFTAGADTCTYTSGNWVVDCSDNCIITEDIDIGANTLELDGTGTFTILADVVADRITKQIGCQIINAQGDGNILAVKLD